MIFRPMAHSDFSLPKNLNIFPRCTSKRTKCLSVIFSHSLNYSMWVCVFVSLTSNDLQSSFRSKFSISNRSNRIFFFYFSTTHRLWFFCFALHVTELWSVFEQILNSKKKKSLNSQSINQNQSKWWGSN